MSVSLLQIPQLRELEEKYARILGPGVLMERAGKAAADFISDLYPAPARVTVVCGPGNNGGDGYRTAIELLKKEYDVNVVQVAGKTPKSEEAIAALAEWEKLGRTTYTDPYDTPKADIVVDAIFGIGLERPLKDEFLDAAMWFNERRALHVSLDIPSGLNSETGTWVGDRAGCKADATISFLSGKVGLFTGLGPDACGRGHDSIILSLVPPKRSHSKAAQGGMQASLANVIKGVGDNEDVHFGDTVRGSDWGADQEVVRMFVNTAPKAVRELAAWGVPWSRITPGDRQVIINGEKVTITERKEAAGLIGQRDFGGTKKWRTCFVSDGTGHAMLNAVSDRAIALGIPIHERVEAIALIHDGSRCYGAVVRDLITGELIGYVARATAIATGGAGKIFRVSTNAQICEGTGHAIALETGVAMCGNLEAVQFHPTGIFPAGILVTEGCRGDGGLLRDVDGHRFMPDVEPEKKELASRDVVSRRMEERIAQGKGVKSRFGEHLWLDITLLGENHIKHNLREVYEICHYFLGVDPTKDWIPVRPAQHYTMGGVRTNPNGESQTLKGLFAAGEAACWDMHGFNRLGGNSVAETVVAGMIIGETIADFCDKPENAIDIPTRVVYDFIKREQSKLDAFVKNNGKENMAEIRTRMQEIMTTKVGIFREGEKLKEAVEELEDLYKKSFNVAVKNQPGANPELVYAYRTQKMLRVALGMALGASLRTESRGAHFRVDYPVRNDAEWCKRTLSTWKNESDTLPTITYQDLDISKMELPPGWRGYGAKNYIDNPETPVRQKQVDEIRAKLESEGADRFAVQNALMPYLQLLPEDLRGKNERIDEPLS